jgi:hypothetical protein
MKDRPPISPDPLEVFCKRRNQGGLEYLATFLKYIFQPPWGHNKQHFFLG